MKANESETYPMQFKDKIDEYLWKEHQIPGGCCFFIENLKYSVAREVTEKLTNTFIEKAVKWISNNCYIPHATLEDFKNYMKGE